MKQTDTYGLSPIAIRELRCMIFGRESNWVLIPLVRTLSGEWDCLPDIELIKDPQYREKSGLKSTG